MNTFHVVEEPKHTLEETGKHERLKVRAHKGRGRGVDGYRKQEEARRVRSAGRKELVWTREGKATLTRKLLSSLGHPRSGFVHLDADGRVSGLV